MSDWPPPLTFVLHEADRRAAVGRYGTPTSASPPVPYRPWRLALAWIFVLYGATSAIYDPIAFRGSYLLEHEGRAIVAIAAGLSAILRQREALRLRREPAFRVASRLRPPRLHPSQPSSTATTVWLDDDGLHVAGLRATSVRWADVRAAVVHDRWCVISTRDRSRIVVPIRTAGDAGTAFAAALERKFSSTLPPPGVRRSVMTNGSYAVD